MVAKGWGRWGPHASLVAPHRPTRIGSSDRQVLTDRCWAGVGGARGPVSVCVCVWSTGSLHEKRAAAGKQVCERLMSSSDCERQCRDSMKIFGNGPTCSSSSPMLSWWTPILAANALQALEFGQIFCLTSTLLCFLWCYCFFFLCPNRVLWFRSLDGLLCVIEISGVNNG